MADICAAPENRCAINVLGFPYGYPDGDDPKSRRNTMKWAAPVVSEICVGMEVTSYESAEIDTFN
jgi:coenzyme PQQ precursor peptide PqqA